MPTLLGDQIKDQGWCTGSVISHEMVPLLTPHLTRPGGVTASVGSDDWIVIVSQTCDVLAKKITQEPFVEVLHCRPIEKLRAGYKELRSTRILDFKPNRDTHEQVVLSAHAISDRYLTPRDLLGEHAPDATRQLSSSATMRVLAWYALRYARPAWPDKFVARIGKDGEEALKTALEPLKDDIAEVRISITERDKELSDDAVYHVAIFFVVDEPVWVSGVENRKTIHAAFAKFVSVLDACSGISVDKDLSDVFSGAEFSWQATRSSDEWNFASLTHQE